MSMGEAPSPTLGLILASLLGVGATLLSGAGTLMPAVGADSGAGRDAGTKATDSQLSNPHSDLIFRATGATTCRDCHQIDKSGSLSSRAIDNDLTRNLRAKAKGIHGPGRFADCLRCHAGGSKGVEKYGTAR
ncbi:MAG TPA: hypothetical protein VKP13_07795 [Nitrospira sp.]|nr:hypothetical protein [Nitrospira sp.]